MHRDIALRHRTERETRTVTDEATAATEPEPAPAPAPAPASPPPPVAPTPPPSDSGSGLKAAALLLLLGGVGWNLFATMSTASKQGSSSVVPSPSRTSTSASASKASSASPDSKSASKGSKDAKATKSESSGSKSGVTSVKAPPSVSEEGQVYHRKAGNPIKVTATGGDWALVSPPSNVYSIEIPKDWTAYEAGSPNDLLVKPPDPSKASLVVIPFNAVDASDIPGEIGKAETAYLGNPGKRDESTTSVDDEEAFLRTYVCNRKSGLERVEVLWVHNSSTQVVPVILRGPEGEIEKLADTFAHISQSFKNLVKSNGPATGKEPAAKGEGGAPPTAGKDAGEVNKRPSSGPSGSPASPPPSAAGKGPLAPPPSAPAKSAPAKSAPAKSAPAPSSSASAKGPVAKPAATK